MTDLPADILALLDRARDTFLADPAAAVAAASQALAALSDEAPAAQRSTVLRHLGLARAYTNDPAPAMADLQAALALVPAGEPALRAHAERALSMACDHVGVLDQALDWAVRSAASAREAGDEQLLADALLSCGVARSRAGDAEGGLAHYREVLRLHESAGRWLACVSALNNIGINLKNLGRLEEAVAHLQRADRLLESLPHSGARPMLYTNLAEPLWRLGRLDEAQAVLDAALSMLAGPVHGGFEANARLLRGQVLRSRGEPGAALQELTLAQAAAQRLGRVDTQAKVHLALSDLHADAGRHDLALAHHRAFHDADRQQIDAEAARRLQGLQVQADLAQARHEAEVYRLRHGEIAEAHDRLQAMHRALLDADREKTSLLTQLAAQSRTDTLTGLANRRRLDEHLVAEYVRSRRLGRALTVAMCDLDNFKQINDRLGHITGDEVLRRVATVLRGACRDIDLVARYGGEEFCIVFAEADLPAAHRACEAARAAVARHDWTQLHPDLQVTVSIGIADGAGCAAYDELLSRADQRLYEAKRQGKNRVAPV